MNELGEMGQGRQKSVLFLCTGNYYRSLSFVSTDHREPRLWATLAEGKVLDCAGDLVGHINEGFLGLADVPGRFARVERLKGAAIGDWGHDYFLLAL
jgi:hypothetical protein